MKRVRAVLFWAAACLLLPGCGRRAADNAPAGQAAAAPRKTAADFFPVGVGGRRVAMQLAVSGAEMARGLMGRRDLGADEGMLFVYGTPQRMSFWMRNTPTPLDIGFFDAEGVLREIHALVPFDETPVASTGTALLFALEVNRGWFDRNGVAVGARLDLEAVRAGLRARALRADF
ncbi:MAG: DUF192 domain-containing protein [Opitutaceae bacterium]|nr:DUF192 domain-containing protein [Opitutaceae bacterium]